MQYRPLMLDHSRLGNCFRRRHRSYKCHLWRLFAVHIRRRMLAGIYPVRDKTGDYAFCLHQFPLLITSISCSLNLTSSPIYSLPHSRFCLVTQRLSCGDSSFLGDERFIDVCHSGNSLLSSVPVETKLVTVSLIHSTQIACKVSLFLLNEVYICLLKF